MDCKALKFVYHFAYIENFYFLYVPMNFKNNAVPPKKQPTFTWYGNEYMQQPKKWISLLTLFIVIVLTFVVAFMVFKNYDRITNLFVASGETSETFTIGQDIVLSGMLHADGDLISYTHTLTLPDAMVIGLKSRSLDLSIYSGIVDIQWVVAKELNDMFIVEVASISGDLAMTGDEESLLWSGSGIYIPQAAIYLPAEFGQKYSLLNQWENGVLKVQNLATNQIIQISYFVCKTSDPNKNCEQLQKNISASAEKKVSTSYAANLYKLEGVTSRYFSNGNNYGYFINDISEEEVVGVVNALILPTEYYIKNTLLSKIQTLCTDGTSSLTQVTTQSSSVDLNGLVVNLQWPTLDWSASCKLFIDPSLAVGATKISYITNTINDWNDVDDDNEDTNTTVSLSDIDTSVKQFPINLEKALTFTSSKWYSIIFPSSNIAYEAVNVREDLGLPGVNCFSQMNVTKFSDKEFMHEEPKVSIFTCSIKGTLNNLGNTLIQKTAENGTEFIIQIVDWSRADFANNIEIN